MASDTSLNQTSSGFLMRLLRDQRGSTYALMSAAIIPLIGLVGGGLDMSRLYLAKTRLQQACDAGALGGRKVMGAGAWVDNGAAETAANNFFDSNFGSGAYGTGALVREFTGDAGGRVTGEASVVVPMTLMKVFDVQDPTIEVACTAQMKLPNTDVMFVLDLSGSMNQNAAGVHDQPIADRKITALKSATKCFYEIVAQIETSADCGFTPAGGTAAGVQIRFGFVNYGSNVNVGKLLPHSAMADTWTYQTRQAYTKPQNYQHPLGTYTTTWPSGTGTITDGGEHFSRGTAPAFDTYSGGTTNNTAQASCTVPNDAPYELTGGEGNRYDQTAWTQSGTTRSRTFKRDTPAQIQYEYERPVTWSSSNGGRCTRRRRTVPGTRVKTYTETQTGTQVENTETRQRPVFDGWRYAALPVNVSSLKGANAGSWNTTLTLPIGDTVDGALATTSKTMTWDGCIEERKTGKANPFSSITSEHWDMEIDRAADPSVAGSQWGPSVRGLVYARGVEHNNWYNDFSDADYPETPINGPYIETNWASTDGSSPFNNGVNWDGPNGPNSYHCPTPSRKLQSWPATTVGTTLNFSDYVDTLVAEGNTYNDVGLVWGARLISAASTALFGDENDFTPSGGEIERHIIFMTDGDVQAQNYNSTAHGVSWYDRRQTSGAPSDAEQIDQVNRRLEAVCAAVKNSSSTPVTLWVLDFSQDPASTNATGIARRNRLRACASSHSRFFAAATSSQLQSAFRTIAHTISELKLTS